MYKMLLMESLVYNSEALVYQADLYTGHIQRHHDTMELENSILSVMHEAASDMHDPDLN